MNRTAKGVVFWLGIVVAGSLFWQVVRTGPADRNVPEISYSQFLSKVADGQVTRVTISGQQVRGDDVKGSRFRAVIPREQSPTLAALEQHGVEIWVSDAPEANWGTWIMNLAPLVLLAALWYFMIRRLQARSRPSGVGPTPTPDSQTIQTPFGSKG